MAIGNWPLVHKLRFRARAAKYAWQVDPCEIQFLRRLLKPGDFAIDIGSHKGGYLYWLQRSVKPQGKVLAFEPQPAAAAYLQKIKNISGYEHVEVINCAVSNSGGPRALFLPSTRVSTGATLVAGLFPENDATTLIDVVTLDAYLGERPDLPPPTFLKIDVETHELEVLQGARQVLQSARPTVQFEADQNLYDSRPISNIFELLQDIGLTGFFFYNWRLLPVREFNVAIHQPTGRGFDRFSPLFANDFIFLDPRQHRSLLQRYGISDLDLQKETASPVVRAA